MAKRTKVQDLDAVGLLTSKKVTRAERARSRKAIQRAQALVRAYIPEGRSLADELIEERRREHREEP